MKQYKQKGLFLSVLLSIIICLSFTLQSYMRSYIQDDLIHKSIHKIDVNSKGSNPNADKPFQTIFYNPYFTNPAFEEFFSVSFIIRKTDRGILNVIRLFSDKVSEIIFPFFSVELLAFAFLSTYKKLNKHVSLIALSIGGHAPPAEKTIFTENIVFSITS